MRGPQSEKLTKDVLQRLYVENPYASLEDVGKELGVSRDAVRRSLKFYGLPIRSRARREGIGLKPHTKILSDRAWLEEQLKDKNMVTIANELNCSDATVFWWARKHGLVATNPKKSQAIKDALAKKYPDGRRGVVASNWKGGRRQMKDGYVRVYAPGHPRAVEGAMQEHRLVMEAHLGRYLEPGEVVHHIDGNRNNNAIENLQLLSNGEHISNHWAAGHEVIAWRNLVGELQQRIEQLERRVEELEAKDK